MNFEFSLEGLHFYIELEARPNHRPDFKHSEWEEEDLELWRDGKLTYFQMIITSGPESSEESSDEASEADTLQHYVPAILLPTDNEAELQERIELFLDGPNGLDKILGHWEENDSDLPDWAE